MSVRYILRIDAVTDEDNQWHIVYGITALDCKGMERASFADIFFDKWKAQEFVNLCNFEKLELIHLADVIDDIFV